MDFVPKYERIKGSGNNMTEDVSDQVKDVEINERRYFLFRSNHPLSGTHLLRRRSVPLIPEIIGPRLPDQKQLQSVDEREMYANIALILVFPFHADRFILEGPGQSSFWSWFLDLERKKRLSTLATSMLRRFQEYYESKRRAAEERAKRRGHEGAWAKSLIPMMNTFWHRKMEPTIKLVSRGRPGN